jgi:hypothetical protein
MKRMRRLAKAMLAAAATFGATVALLQAIGLGMVLWVPAGWLLAGLPALVLGCIVFEGCRVSGNGKQCREVETTGETRSDGK